MNRHTLLSLGLVIATSAFAGSQKSDQETPSFSAFKVPTHKQAPVPAKILTASDRRFRTQIRDGAKRGPNFAGHFTIVTWGCGSGCLSFVVVDAATGKVDWNTPFRIIGMPYKGAHSGRAYDGLAYKLDSRLLVADGCPEDDNEKCGTRYYEWRSGTFRLINFKPDPPTEKITAE